RTRARRGGRGRAAGAHPRRCRVGAEPGCVVPRRGRTRRRGGAAALARGGRGAAGGRQSTAARGRRGAAATGGRRRGARVNDHLFVMLLSLTLLDVAFVHATDVVPALELLPMWLLTAGAIWLRRLQRFRAYRAAWNAGVVLVFASLVHHATTTG